MSVVVSRKPAIIAASLLAAVGVIWLVAEAISAAAFRGYSYATNYISDLGVPEVSMFEGRTIDSPLSAVMNFAFIAQGLLLVAGVILAVRAAGLRGAGRGWIVAVSIAHGIGMLLVGIFHGSEVNIANGFIILHVLGATIAIVTGNVVAILAGVQSRRVGAPSWYRVVSVALGIIGLISLVMLVIVKTTTFPALPEPVWERGAVYTITAWELMTGITLFASMRRSRRLA